MWLWAGNNIVEVSHYEIKGDFPDSFNDFKIVQLSDMHNCSLGENNERVLGKLKKAKADIIVMTGDIIDARDTKIDIAIDFIKEAVKIAPCYFVTGNHEARVKYFTDEFEKFEAEILDLGVTVLRNESCEIKRGNDVITLVGLDDTGFGFLQSVTPLMEKAMPNGEGYKILLAHRPEFFDEYKGVDLIFSGHAHGGQIRLPYLGGLFAPGQGVLPKYDNGVYEEDGRIMVVSRGLGNSLFPLRINNRPEIVVVELKK